MLLPVLAQTIFIEEYHSLGVIGFIQNETRIPTLQFLPSASRRFVSQLDLECVERIARPEPRAFSPKVWKSLTTIKERSR